MTEQMPATSTDFDPTAVEEMRRVISTYCVEERHPDRAMFNVTDLLDWAESSDKKWNNHPAAGRPGCYVVYDSSGSAVYVGKASCGSFVGARLRLRQAAGRWPEARYVQIVEVAEPFEAPSLEEYILSKFRTSRNVNGAKVEKDR